MQIGNIRQACKSVTSVHVSDTSRMNGFELMQFVRSVSYVNMTPRSAGDFSRNHPTRMATAQAMERHMMELHTSKAPAIAPHATASGLREPRLIEPVTSWTKGFIRGQRRAGTSDASPG